MANKSRPGREAIGRLAEGGLGQADEHYLTGLGIADPRHDKSHIEETNGGLLLDTYGWVLEAPEFLRWRGDRNKRLLRIKGEPGTGKTMQLCGLIDELDRSSSDSSSSTPGFLSFAFCQETDSRSNNATAVLRSLIYLLVQRQPSLLRHTRKRRKSAAKHPSGDDIAWASLCHVFFEMLKDPVLVTGGGYFVIDALDECVADLPRLLDLITRTLAVFPRVKWAISSRSLPEIDEQLQIAEREVGLCLQPSSEAISASLDAYVRHSVRRLAVLKGYDSETESSIRNGLGKAGGTFLWISLACRSLASLPQADAVSQLETFPHDLDPLYAHMAQRIQDGTHGELCKRLLAVAAACLRPVTLRELSLFLGISEDASDNQASLAEIVSCCAPFLTLAESSAYFVHSTAKIFLLTHWKATDSDFEARIDEANKTIFSKSLEAMSMTLRRDVYQLQKPGTTIDMVRRPDPDPLDAINYSCVYWVDHLCGLDERGALADDGPVHIFLKEMYLYWLEALSLLGRIPEGVRALVNLDKLLEQTGPASQLLHLVRDARRFVGDHGSEIGHAPLQTYVSALVFTPASSLVRQLHEAEEPSWLVTKPRIEERTGQPQLSEDRHRGPVWSLALSPTNDDTVASASDDTTIKIWNMATGSCLRTLQGHKDLVWSIEFSPDGVHIVSTSDDSTVKIWDVASGRCLRTLEGYGEAAFEVALTLKGHSKNSVVWCANYSRNDELLASGSNDESIKIWDPATGECLKTFPSHNASVYATIFHRNDRLFSASFNGAIKLWNVKTGDIIHTSDHGEGGLYSFALSHNGRGYVSGHRNVKFWDAATGKLVRTVEADNELVWSVAYSHDDALVAGGSVDSSIWLWEARNGKLVRKLKGHEGTVVSTTFSHRDWLLATGSNGGILKIWNAQTGSCLQTIQYGVSKIWSSTFTRGDRLIVAASQNGYIGVFSVATGVSLGMFQKHYTDINFVAFSHGGDQIATSSDDGTIKLWDVVVGGTAWSASFSTVRGEIATCSDDGRILLWPAWVAGRAKPLSEYHTEPVYATAFSHHGLYLATASEDGTIVSTELKGKRANENFVRMLGHSGAVWAVCYSPDDSQIASASSDHTVRIWDTETGDCLRIIDVGTSLSSLSFDTTGSYLRTEIGRIILQDGGGEGDVPVPVPVPRTPAPASESPKTEENSENSKDAAAANDSDESTPDDLPVLQDLERRGYGISLDRTWITHNDENVLLLPLEYRPLSSAVSDRTICIGCRSGRVLFFGVAPGK